MKKPLISGATVQIHQNGEKIDEGLILSVGVWGKESIQKIEYKSTFLRLEGIIEFVSYKGDENYQVLCKNPMTPNQKICNPVIPEYVITTLE